MNEAYAMANDSLELKSNYSHVQEGGGGGGGGGGRLGSFEFKEIIF